MNKVLISMGILLMSAAVAQAASVKNSDAETIVLSVTEEGATREVAIESGTTVSICSDGCFIKPPKDDKLAISGADTVEIINGSAVFD